MGAALVTGGGKRLGAAMVRYLAGRGYDVAVHYHSSPDAAEALVAEIAAQGGRAVALQADLLDEAQTVALLPEAAQKLAQPITCLVNNCLL